MNTTVQIQKYLTDRHASLSAEIQTLRADITTKLARLAEIDFLISGLGAPNIPTLAGAPLPPRQAVFEALKAAGEQGLTAAEACVAAGVPDGTVSSTLSHLKANGKAIHISPRYYIAEAQPIAKPPVAKAATKPKKKSKVNTAIAIICDQLQRVGEVGLTSTALATLLTDHGKNATPSKVRAWMDHAIKRGDIQKVDGGDAWMFVTGDQTDNQVQPEPILAEVSTT